MLRKRIDYAIRAKSLHHHTIAAVHDDDLEPFLASLGLMHDLRTGRLKCKFCGDTLQLESLQAVFPDSGSISLVCTKDSCELAFLDYYRESHELATSD